MIIRNIKTSVKTRDLAREMVKSGKASKMFDNGKQAGKNRWNVLTDKIIERSPNSVKGLMSKRHLDAQFLTGENGKQITVVSKRTKLALMANVKSINWYI